MVEEEKKMKRGKTTGWSTPLHLLLLSVLMTMGCGWLFTSCSDDIEEALVQAHEMDMKLVTSLPVMEDAAANGAGEGHEGNEAIEGTKARRRTSSTWDIPTTSYAPFYSYNALYTGIANASYHSLANKAVDVFFTTGTDASHHGRLHYNETQGWKLSLYDGSDPKDMAEGDYYVYGFIPRNAADNADIALLPGDGKTYADGAVLTINGLPSVMSDACVIIGAREGFYTIPTAGDTIFYDGGFTDGASGTADVYDSEYDTRTNRLQAGDFKFEFKKDNGGNLTNCMFLLFDHICAALNVNFKVDEDYANMRTIKLKNIHMKTATGEGDAITITKKSNVTIRLNKTDDGADPIESIVYEPTSVVSTGDDVYTSKTEEGVQLEITPKTFVGHFMPAGTTTIILTSTYDVYDNNITTEHPKGNLVRKDCTAINIVRLMDLVGHVESTVRGKRYTVDLTIQPTFLYVMSEPDLDNPEVVVE